jgi:cytochrome c oxidase subunit 2
VTPKRFQLLMLAGVTATIGGLAACGADPDSAATSEGQRLFNTKGCIACHGPNGSGGMAPAWKGLYMTQVTLTDGTTVTADDAYLSLAMTNPNAQQVKGYPMMPPNSLTAVEVQAIIDYIKTLK